MVSPSRHITAFLAALAAFFLVGCGQLSYELSTPSEPQESIIESDEPTETDTNALAPENLDDYPTVQARVIRIVDGDTIAVEPTNRLPATSTNNDYHGVRILGIDAPEMDWDTSDHECGGQEALENLEGLIAEGSNITLAYSNVSDHTDRYGRSLAYVQTANGMDVGKRLVRDGYVAAWYPQSAPEPERHESYEALQQSAQNNAKGSWATCDTMGR